MSRSKLFFLIRNRDFSGVSGIGKVLDGVVWHTGQVTVCWRTEHSSIATYPTWEDFKAVHIDSHPENETEIHWYDKGEK